eukprot:g31679.t1
MEGLAMSAICRPVHGAQFVLFFVGSGECVLKVAILSQRIGQRGLGALIHCTQSGPGCKLRSQRQVPVIMNRRGGACSRRVTKSKLEDTTVPLERFALFLLFGKILLRIFIGTLRDVEVEQLVDSGRGFLAETILFLVGTVFLIQYICCVIFMKVFHLTTQIRVSHMFEVGVPRLIVTVKLVGLMALLLGCDLLALNYFYSVASRSSTFFTWILFEALTMSTVVLVSMCRYSIHMVDLRLENGWPAKSAGSSAWAFCEIVLGQIFMLTFFVQNPSRLPIYMMADVIQVARKLAQRLRSFRRYRCISRNMELRFPDATDAEIEENEHCVICRDSLFDGSKPKKLSCNHIFHIASFPDFPTLTFPAL